MVALSMILEAIWPLLEYGVMFLIRWVKLGIDQRSLWPRRPEKTSKSSIYEFD